MGCKVALPEMFPRDLEDMFSGDRTQGKHIRAFDELSHPAVYWRMKHIASDIVICIILAKLLFFPLGYYLPVSEGRN